MKQAPIGIFDSGLGGLSVLRHIRDQLPNESLSYFADSGFAPYGDRTEEEILQRTLLVVQYLLNQGIKALVIACNTATTAASLALRAQYPDLILVAVEPGLKPAASLTKTGCIGVLATSRTLASSKYQRLCDRVQQTASLRIINQACPGLVELIEKGALTSDTTTELLTRYLQPIFDAQADTIVLGCTHYPFVEDTIKKIAKVGSKLPIEIVDTGTAIARQLQRLLENNQLEANPVPHPTMQFTTTGDAKLLELGLHQLLQLRAEQYSIQEISCNLSVG